MVAAVIPYELIVCSASRPHLLEPTLRTLLTHDDQWPERIWVHDDAVFVDRQEAVALAINRAVMSVLRLPNDVVPKEVTLLCDNPPIRHGPALARLLGQVRTEYVLYSQDDHEVVRPLPVRDTLGLMEKYHRIVQIRYNKRDTGPVKGEPNDPEAFHKVTKVFELDGKQFPLTTADHFYFQTNVFRVASLKPIVDWWMAHPEHGTFSEHAEIKTNRVMNGEYLAYHPTFPPEVPILQPGDGAWNDPEVRARVHGTWIWGPIGEKRFIDHLGADPKDWAMVRNRG